MSNAEPLKRLYVRATPEARKALKVVRASVLDLPGTEDVSQEEFVAASWLWMASLDPEELSRLLAPHVAALRSSVQGLTAGPAKEPESPHLELGTEINRPEELPEIRRNVSDYEEAKRGRSPKARRRSE